VSVRELHVTQSAPKDYNLGSKGLASIVTLPKKNKTIANKSTPPQPPPPYTHTHKLEKHNPNSPQKFRIHHPDYQNHSSNITSANHGIQNYQGHEKY